MMKMIDSFGNLYTAQVTFNERLRMNVFEGKDNVVGEVSINLFGLRYITST
jgi:hypothetical protein